MEQSDKIGRTEIWHKIYEVLEGLGLKDVEGDGLDRPSAATKIEKEVKKLLPINNVSSYALDYSFKKGEFVWFTFKTHPKKEDWFQAEILDLNWAYKSAAIKIDGFSGVFSTGISALHRERHLATP